MKRLLICAAILLPLFLSPVISSARPPTQDKEIVDARLEGYGENKNNQTMDKNVTIEGGGTALTWVLLIFLTGLGLSVMFKNAKRTHLD